MADDEGVCETRDALLATTNDTVLLTAALGGPVLDHRIEQWHQRCATELVGSVIWVTSPSVPHARSPQLSAPPSAYCLALRVALELGARA